MQQNSLGTPSGRYFTNIVDEPDLSRLFLYHAAQTENVEIRHDNYPTDVSDQRKTDSGVGPNKGVPPSKETMSVRTLVESSGDEIHPATAGTDESAGPLQFVAQHDPYSTGIPSF